MANPALKNGYISIANELVEQFAKHNIPGNEMRIVWVLWRKTWGWSDGSRKKDWDWISISQFEKATGMKHSNVAKSVKSLVVKRLLLKGENGLKFNQNHEEWVVVKRLPPVVKSILPSSQKHTEIGSQKHTYKRNKETTTKEIASQSDAGLIVKVIDSFKEVNPAFGRWYGNKTQRASIDRLILTHGVEKLEKVITLLGRTNGMKYFPTITTPMQLEEKWAQLESALIRKKSESKRMVII